MHKKGFPLALFIIAVSGCANKVWYRHDATMQDFYRDRGECSAMSGAGGSNQIYSAPQVGNDPFSSGFQQGWNNASAIGSSIERNRIFNDCMAGRGWSLVSKKSISSIQSQSAQRANNRSLGNDLRPKPDTTDYLAKSSVFNGSDNPYASSQSVDPDMNKAVGQLMSDPFKSKTLSPVDRFWRDLAQQVPNFVEINSDPRFHDWLSITDSTTGKRRQDLLIEAQRRNDADTVAAMFKQYLKTI